MALNSALKSPKLGAYYTAIPSLLAGVCATFGASNRNYLNIAMSAGSIAWIIGLIGSFSDGVASTILDSLQTCVNKKFVSYGNADSDMQTHAINCIILYNISSDIACTNPSGRCVYFDGTSDGNYILGAYTQLARVAKSFDYLLEVTIFFLTCVLYNILGVCCCNRGTVIYVSSENQLPSAQVCYI